MTFVVSARRGVVACLRGRVELDNPDGIGAEGLDHSKTLREGACELRRCVSRHDRWVGVEGQNSAHGFVAGKPRLGIP